jgi:hypothetical protein
MICIEHLLTPNVIITIYPSLMCWYVLFVNFHTKHDVFVWVFVLLKLITICSNRIHIPRVYAVLRTFRRYPGALSWALIMYMCILGHFTNLKKQYRNPYMWILYNAHLYKFTYETKPKVRQ